MRFIAALMVLLLAGCATTGTLSSAETDDPADDLPGETVDLDRARRGQQAALLSDLLRGRVSGVRVTNGPTGPVVRVRGSKGDPLYVVDGVPVKADPGGGLRFVNPADVASIRVLKGAYATSAYGVQGAHGVIVVTTRIGASDRGDRSRS